MSGKKFFVCVRKNRKSKTNRINKTNRIKIIHRLNNKKK